MVCPSVHYGEKCRERCSGHCINNEHWKFLMVCLLCRTFITTCYNTPDLRTTRAHSTVMIIRFVVYAISTSTFSTFLSKLSRWTLYLNLNIPYHTIPSPLTGIKVIRPKLIKHSQNTFISKIALLFLHLSPVYPGLHPLSHWPVCLLHGVLFRQWPLQLLAQSYP